MSLPWRARVVWLADAKSRSRDLTSLKGALIGDSLTRRARVAWCGRRSVPLSDSCGPTQPWGGVGCDRPRADLVETNTRCEGVCPLSCLWGRFPGIPPLFGARSRSFVCDCARGAPKRSAPFAVVSPRARVHRRLASDAVDPVACARSASPLDGRTPWAPSARHCPQRARQRRVRAAPCVSKLAAVRTRDERVARLRTS